MPHRLLQAILPRELSAGQREELDELHALTYWQTPTLDDHVLLNMVVDAGGAEPVIEWLKQRFGHDERFRVSLLPLVATHPLPDAGGKDEERNGEEEEEEPRRPQRISRDELMSDILDATRVNRVFLMMSFISAMVAAGGVLRDNTAIVIGAMVIAPLLGPNVALCLATTLADLDLARTALKANLLGVAVALIPSLLLGLVLKVDASTPEIASRTNVGIGDLAIAIASGGAGVLAFTTGVSSALIGVMVAVALMPPLVTFGLLAGSGQFDLAGRALLLLAANIICINLTGILAFFLQGVRPTNWWEARRAARATRISILIWIVLLIVLVGLIAHVGVGA